MRKPEQAFISVTRAAGRLLRPPVLPLNPTIAHARSRQPGQRSAPWVLLQVVVLLGLAAPVLARTPVQTRLTNTVSAAWSNATGIRFTATASATHTVSNFIDFDLTGTGGPAAVGETNLLPFILSVSNNFSDRFRLLVRSNAVTDMRIRFCADYNGNGLIDGGDRFLTNTDPLAEGARYRLLVAVSVPASYPAGVTNIFILETVSFRSNAMLNGRVFTTNRIVTAVFSNQVTVRSAADSARTLSVLDGSAALSDDDVTVTVHFASPPHSASSLRIWYDTLADPDGPSGTNAVDRSAALRFNGVDWTAVIPASDAGIVNDALVRFVVEADHRIYAPPAGSWKYRVASRPDQGAGFDVFPTVVDLSRGDCFKILYRVLKPGAVRIDIYDLKGDLVRIFDEGIRVPGEFGAVDWCGENQSGMDVSAGLYFIAIRAAGLTETRKVIIIK